jgi:hypothetical protein
MDNKDKETYILTKPNLDSVCVNYEDIVCVTLTSLNKWICALKDNTTIELNSKCGKVLFERMTSHTVTEDKYKDIRIFNN